MAILLFLVGASAWIYQIYWGLGIAGYEPPVMWGVYIVTFVFWVGIGHAGTLISAILYLFRAGFRTTIYRCAEAMTVFAVMTAGLFPIIHIGRPWKFFWLIPYPNWRLIWPNFKSPLVWDVFAISTYLTVSATFLYVGLIPDIAVLRDRETNPMRKQILAILSLGWRNSEPEWRHFMKMYLFLAAFSTPLVLSVHSVVSFDFAMALTPGLARDDLPAVLRRRRHLLRHRDGLHDHHPHPEVLQARALRHDQPPRRGGQALPLHVDGRRLRLPHRVLGRVVLGRRGGAGVLLEPRLRRVVVGRVDHAHLQHGLPALALLAEAAPQPDAGSSSSRSSSTSGCGSSAS